MRSSGLHDRLRRQTGTAFPISAEKAEFHIAADGGISEAYAETRNMELTAGFPEIVRAFEVFGPLPPNFNEQLRKARDTRSFEPLRDVGAGNARDVEPSIGVGFVPGDFVPEAPYDLYVRIGVRLYWRNKAWHGKVRRDPIKAPPGYEQFSMDPVITPAEVPRRKSVASIAAAKMETPIPIAPVSTPLATTPVPQGRVYAVERGRAIWFFVVGILCVAGLALLVWWRHK